jgi:hypothetical protein
MRRRLIFQRVRERGYGGLPDPPDGAHDDPDTVAELAQETVAKALRHFHDDVLVPGKWDSRRGATLRTYFIGQCLIRFANIYRRWWRRGLAGGVQAAFDALARGSRSGLRGPADSRTRWPGPVRSATRTVVRWCCTARA